MRDFGKITMGELVDHTSINYPDNDALVCPDRGLRYSYKEFREISNQFAKGLLKLGVKRGENIAIWATNVPEWVITQFGSARIGAVMATVSTSYKLLELEYQLKQSDATTLIMIEGTRHSDFINLIYELCPELSECKPGELVSKRLPLLKNVIMIGNNEYPGMFTWNDVIKLGEEVSDEALTSRSATLDPDDAIVMIYTSGTTGFPKGVMLTHHNIIANAKAQAECLNLGPSDRMCIAVPFFHCFGIVASNVCCVVSGAAMVPVELFNPVQVLKTVEKEQCTVLHGVPTMFILELEQMEKEKYDVSSLRTGIVAGSACSPDVVKQLAEVMNMREIITSYGQSEASPCITSTRINDSIELKATTVGKALPGVEVKLVNPETGEEVALGEQGEICARGYNIMKGYYKMPEATAATIDEEGWLHTGDLGIMDEYGYCKITCRLKEMIIRGGENIYPKEVEEFLRIHPLIKDAQVVGVPSEKFGEEVMAFIRVKDGHVLTPESVQNFCKGQIANWKIPRYVAFVEDYPYTANGKVQKFKLREMAIEILDPQEVIKPGNVCKVLV
ncbi:MAG: AMP-binding protein [Desulfotomaculaceae bacterium]|nr:AMP-binding protein [Desulfotomaculaceae bacterium]